MKKPELVVASGELAGKRYQVGTGGLRLGRSSSNDIQMNLEELSRNHCLFELAGDAIRVTDLASANGTFVNGELLGADPRPLKVGDVVEVGGVSIRVEGETQPDSPAAVVAPTASKPAETKPAETKSVPAAPAKGGPVDLGLGRPKIAKPPLTNGAPKRSPIANLLWLVVLGVVGFAAYLVLDDMWSQAKQEASSPTPVAEEDGVVEFAYEKVDATSESVFRYAMTMSDEGVLTVELDDVPAENRHVVKSQKLGPEARKRLDEILTAPEFLSLDGEYAGPVSEPPTLRSRILKVVFRGSVKRVSCQNAVEPDVFLRLRDKLETFSKNELGVWAMGHSRAQLLDLAAASAATAADKWENRDVAYGNIAASIKHYRDAISLLETVNPKPDVFDGYKSALTAAERELDARYREQRFKADRAINLSDWETARNELRVLCEMVPDRDDDRYREASGKLVDVEKRMKK